MERARLVVARQQADGGRSGMGPGDQGTDHAVGPGRFDVLGEDRLGDLGEVERGDVPGPAEQPVLLEVVRLLDQERPGWVV